MSAWAWWEAVARLERIKQIAGRHVGPTPAPTETWMQLCHVHLVAMGVER